MNERDRWKEQLQPELVARFMQTFVNRTDQYPVQLPDGRYTHVTEPLTSRDVYAHLFHKITLGAYALNPESQAKWLCVDVDEDDGLNQLRQLAEFLLYRKQPSYLETSRRGGHLWLFFPPRPGVEVRRFGQQLVTEAGLTTRIELYPRQDELRDGPGSLVRLPFGVHRKTGKVYHFIDLSGQPIGATIRDQIGILSQPEQIDHGYIEYMLRRAPKLEPVRRQQTYTVGEVAADASPSTRVKQAVSVLDFVSGFVDLDSSGVGRCPFHDDQHASFQVNAKDNYWNCYAGCGGGSIIDFWMRWRRNEGLSDDFGETVRDLHERFFGERVSGKRRKK